MLGEYETTGSFDLLRNTPGESETTGSFGTPGTVWYLVNAAPGTVWYGKCWVVQARRDSHPLVVS